MIGGGIISSASGLLSRFDTNEFELANAKTFPRRSVHLRCEDEAKLPTKSEDTVCVSSDVSVSIPQQSAPRPMTLPTRGAASRLHKSDFLLNATRPKAASNSNGTIVENGINDKQSPCESPSYLTNTFYTFPDKNAISPTEVESDTCNDSNPIPVPSREGKKHIKTNPKRHVRKYPLIIPAYGVQRTLNKVTEITNFDDDEIRASSHQADSSSDRNLNQGSQIDPSTQNSINLRRFTHEVVATVRPSTRNSASYENTFNMTVGKTCERTYINLPGNSQDASFTEAISTTDSASLQFESILENDVNKVDVLQSPDVTDGFYNFSIQKEQFIKGKEMDFDKRKISGLCENEDVLKNLDIEKNLNIVATSSSGDSVDSPEKIIAPKIVTTNPNMTQFENLAMKISLSSTNSKNTSAKISKQKQSNELAGHALFKKVRESVDQAMTHGECARTPAKNSVDHNSNGDKTIASRLKDSNSVSCEDLLEFSDKKPRGCERGVDSDEVRIMVKVLGSDTTPTRCLHVLEFINWDVHKAIKLIKLQNIISPTDLSLTDSVKALQKFEWDLHRASLNLKCLK